MGEQQPLTPEAIIARIDDWKGRDTRCEPLGGGITNHNYLVSVDGGPGRAARSTSCASLATAPTCSSTVTRAYLLDPRRQGGVGPAVAYDTRPEGAWSSTSSTARSCTPRRSPAVRSGSSRSIETVKLFHEGDLFRTTSSSST